MTVPETIQALGFIKTGDIDVMEKLEVPFAEPKPNQIVVKVQWAGVNSIDTYYRKGLYKLDEFPQVSGFEAAGTIVGLPTDDAVLKDPQYQKRGYKYGANVALYWLGSHAEYVSVKWDKVAVLPDSISTEKAASSLLMGLTAITHMTEAYNVQKGDTVLIYTVAGGLGLLYTQYAKARGATVIGVTSNVEKAKLAKSNGADHVILYSSENIVHRVLEITNGVGVDAVFDTVGKDTFMDNFKLAKRKGTLVSVGNASGPVEPIAPLRLAEKNLKLVRPSMAVYIVTPEESYHYYEQLWKELSAGSLNVPIFKTYPFSTEGVREAQRDLTTPGGKVSGKLLIKIAD